MRGKPGHAHPVFRREVGAAVEGLQVGRQEDRHRPAAPARHRLHRLHVDRVQLRALFPVHLDVHEVLVHHLGDVRVLERLPLHDVAPVARGIADAEEDWLALLLRPRQRLRPPRVPLHGVVRMLLQVGAGLVDQSIWHGPYLIPSASAGERGRSPRACRRAPGPRDEDSCRALSKSRRSRLPKTVRALRRFRQFALLKSPFVG